MRKFFAPLIFSLVLLLGLCLPQPTTNTFVALAGQPGRPDTKVWVNTKSGVYHCPGTRWYGNTKQGEFLTETQARDKRFRPAYGKPCGPAGETSASASGGSTEHETVPASSADAGNPDTKVWLNIKSGVYHCPGTRWYGSTKNGEYITQKQARDKGNRPAYGKPCQ